MMKRKYSIGEISKIYHIGLDSIRYYEEISLISPKRNQSNYRYYDKDDIYRLNIIRELLDLGFSTNDISSYFNNRNIKSTYDLLKLEKDRIDRSIAKLKLLKDNVDSRLKEIKDIKHIKFDEVHEKTYDIRKYFLLDVSYKYDSDMDILIQQLSEKEKDHFYIIGNNQIGTFIPENEFINKGKMIYQSVFLISKNGDHILDKGTYLSIAYQGAYNRSYECLNILKNYATTHKYILDSNFLEIIWIDNHSTKNVDEYVTELQVKVINKIK